RADSSEQVYPLLRTDVHLLEQIDVAAQRRDRTANVMRHRRDLRLPKARGFLQVLHLFLEAAAVSFYENRRVLSEDHRYDQTHPSVHPGGRFDRHQVL